MRVVRWGGGALVLGCVVAASCNDGPLDVGATDLGPEMAALSDLAASADAAVPLDLALPRDQAVPVDQAAPLDLWRPDLTLVQPPGFTLPTKYPNPGATIRVVVGDVNEDGKLDAVTLDNGTGDAGSSSTVSVYLGNGDGTLGAPASVQTVSTGSLVLADFNEDHHLDRAIGVHMNFVGFGGILVSMGNGDGTFGAWSYVGVNDVGPVDLVAADVNHDGHVDLVFPTNEASSIDAVLGHGDGTFTASTSSSGLLYTAAMAVGPFVGDDSLDVVATGQGGAGVMRGAPDGGNGTFASTGIFSDGCTNVSTVIRARDLDGDGVLDLIVGCSSAGSPDPTFTVLKGGAGPGGAPNGTFGAPVPYSAGGYGVGIALADFDRDGVVDVAVVKNAKGMSLLRGNAGDAGALGTFSFVANYYTGGNPVDVAAGDFNGDGKPDLIVALWYPSPTGLAILLNTF